MAKAEGETMDWKHLLAYITGTVDQALLLRNAYLVTENRILGVFAHPPKKVNFSNTPLSS
jgi:hypothetical protein